MEKSDDTRPRWALEADPFFTFLGIYVASFQWLEAKLDEIILFSRGFNHRAETQHMLAGMANAAKIEEARQLVLAAEGFPRIRDLPGWLDRFSALMDRLQTERIRRNDIVHSGYVLEKLEEGVPAMRVNRRRDGLKVQFHAEEMTTEWMDNVIENVACLCMELGQANVQLIALSP